MTRMGVMTPLDGVLTLGEHGAQRFPQAQLSPP